MTDRERLIEAMARVIYDDLEGPVANQDFTRQMRQWARSQELAHAALSAIEAMGCVVVPVEATDRMIEAAHVAMFETPFTGETMVMVGAGLDAALAASPFAKEPT
jgi:uncharacterized protein YgbK (DUF1537 family)